MPVQSRATAPKPVVALIDRFQRKQQAYRDGHDKAPQFRREFLDPLFIALGWDIDNARELSAASRDAVHEASLRMAESSRAPEYSFRVNGTRKFFVETKLPGASIQADAQLSFQLRRHAWTAKLALGIVTDFEGFAVYDCRIKPDQHDQASTARILYISYRDYVEKWGEIAGLFSREAVLKGALEKFAETAKRRRGTVAVEDAFLETIETWRMALASNLARRNQSLTQDELNFSVQRIIDRILFLRICEGRGIEDDGRLLSLTNGKGTYARLCKLFELADARYNSGLFHFDPEVERHAPPDSLTRGLSIDDELLHDILKGLYPPESPYVFSLLPADILGQVYEQFLGKTIRLTEGHRAVVEEKPEVKKAGGVYYTPTYIVSHMIRSTVGKLLKDKTPKQVAKLRVLDPACGSGSFLLVAYECLLQWHLDYYAHNEPSKWTTAGGQCAVCVSAAGWQLTTAERKRILLNNIYGVDIDAQAVETTKLSLLLKLLEGESQRRLQPEKLSTKRCTLPNLGANIKCGNALIASDFYLRRPMPALAEEERSRINAFDWASEFPGVSAAGGFDAVIGNPPYLYSAAREHREYFSSHYALAEYQTDFYVYFLEKGLGLLRKNGYMGMIVSDSWLKGSYFGKLRRHLLEATAVQSVVVFDYLPFAKAIIENSVILLIKGPPTEKFSVDVFRTPDRLQKLNELSSAQCVERDMIDVRACSAVDRVLAKVECAGRPLSAYCRLNRGVHAYRTDGYGKSKFGSGPQIQRDKDERVYHANRRVNPSYLPEIKGKHLLRYGYHWDGSYISYGDWLAEPRCPEYFMQPKLVIRKILADRLICTWIREPIILDQSIYVAIVEPGKDDLLLHILGILASCIGGWYIQRKHSIYDTLYPWFTKAQLAAFPIKIAMPTSNSGRTKRLPLARPVKQMFALRARRATAKTPQERASLERKMVALDAQIDRIVSELYALTEDEMQLISNTRTDALGSGGRCDLNATGRNTSRRRVSGPLTNCTG